jgi:uncharacterized protein
MPVVIFKPTERCNSNCVYCDVVERKVSGATMPLSTLETVFERVGEFLRDRPDESIDLIWHGGEPLLLGPDYFHKAADFEERHCGKDKDRINHALQTNLTLMDASFFECLDRLRIRSVGTSYDPEPTVRGYGAERDTIDYNKDFLRGAALLAERGIGYGIIYVVTKKSLSRPVEVFRFLANLRPGGGFNMNPVILYEEDRKPDIAVTPEEYADFLGAIFRLWWPSRARYPEVEPFKSYVVNISRTSLRLGCSDSGDCSSHYVTIDPSGRASHCGRSSDWNLLDYGSVRERSLADILADGQRAALLDRQAYLRNGPCSGCELWFMCHGGCPLDAYARLGTFDAKSHTCEAKRRFVHGYFEPITGMKVGQS